MCEGIETYTPLPQVTGRWSSFVTPPSLSSNGRNEMNQWRDDFDLERLTYNLHCREGNMLLELSVIPLGRGRSISADVADLVRIIDGSGLDYRLTAAGTILEGNWDQLIDVARKCHTEMRKKTERVITFMKIDDYAERTGRLTAAVASVEAKVGKPVRK